MMKSRTDAFLCITLVGVIDANFFSPRAALFATLDS